MAYSDKTWDKVKADYEIHGLSFDKLSKQHPMVKSVIIARAKKHSWEKGKTDLLISSKVLIRQENIENDKITAQLTTKEVREVEKAVSFALEMNGIYEDLEKEIAVKTKEVVMAVDISHPMASVNVRNLAQTLQALKDKQKLTTQVNIQNNGDIAKNELKNLTLNELRELRGTV